MLTILKAFNTRVRRFAEGVEISAEALAEELKHSGHDLEHLIGQGFIRAGQAIDPDYRSAPAEDPDDGEPA